MAYGFSRRFEAFRTRETITDEQDRVNCFKLLRPHLHHRHRLGAFCRIVARLLNEAYKEGAPWGRVGFILFVQTFGRFGDLEIVGRTTAPFRHDISPAAC